MPSIPSTITHSLAFMRLSPVWAVFVNTFLTLYWLWAFCFPFSPLEHVRKHYAHSNYPEFGLCNVYVPHWHTRLALVTLAQIRKHVIEFMNLAERVREMKRKTADTWFPCKFMNAAKNDMCSGYRDDDGAAFFLYRPLHSRARASSRVDCVETKVMNKCATRANVRANDEFWSTHVIHA